MSISFSSFYNNYYGHLNDHINILQEKFNKNKIIYFVGDSILDNKSYTLQYQEDAVNGYENIIDNKKMCPDVSYWLNKFLFDNNKDYKVINCAVEEACVEEKMNSLNSKDMRVQSYIKKEDILVVSLSGNDLSLKMSLSNKLRMAKLIYMTSKADIQKNPNVHLDFMITICKNQLQTYIEKLTQNAVPSKIIICSIIYPCIDTTQSSWANTILSLINYNKDPEMIQMIIDLIFEHGIKQINIPGSQMEFLNLSKLVDCNNPNLYVQRVEPSKKGGYCIAKGIYDTI